MQLDGDGRRIRSAARAPSTPTTWRPSGAGPFQRGEAAGVASARPLPCRSLLVPLLRFDLRDGSVEGPITIGHQDGVITLDTAEADPARREQVRTSLGEPYRSPLGHVRHELGHWYWQAHLGNRFSTECVPGRVRRRVGVVLPRRIERHYASVDDGSWLVQYISYYASMHPWEDFAESFAHLLHITDTLETAAAYGLGSVGAVAVALGVGDFQRFYQQWIDVSVALNELNRSMGAPDAYPFAPSSAAIAKLEFVWDQLSEGAPARA